MRKTRLPALEPRVAGSLVFCVYLLFSSAAVFVTFTSLKETTLGPKRVKGWFGEEVQKQQLMQATYNQLVDAFCDPLFLQQHHLTTAQITELRARLHNLWFRPVYNRWITTYLYPGHTLNYRRVMMTLGYVMAHSSMRSKIDKKEMSVHLISQCPDLSFYQDFIVLRTILGKKIDPKIEPILRSELM